MQIKILGGDEVRRSEGWLATHQAFAEDQDALFGDRYCTLNKAVVTSCVALVQKTAVLVNKTDFFALTQYIGSVLKIWDLENLCPKCLHRFIWNIH